MITIFSTKSCPKCDALKAHCRETGIAYEEKRLAEDLLDDGELMTDLRIAGVHLGYAAPVIQVGSSYFGQDAFFDGNTLNIARLKELIG
jgi:glutaredoxin